MTSLNTSANLEKSKFKTTDVAMLVILKGFPSLNYSCSQNKAL